MIDILAVKPHKVSRSLRGYTTLLYSQPKAGKSRTAARFPKALFLATEIGYLAIPNVMAVPITSWSEFKQALRQLKQPAAHEAYETIVIDTIDILADLCEKYVCSQNGVDKISEVPFGGGYSQMRHEFDEGLRSIPMMGYGLVMISHAEDRTFTDEDGKEFNQIVPTLPKSPRLIVDRMSDIICYAAPEQQEDGSVKMIGYLRGTPRFVAGSRFKYIVPRIEFNYDSLVKAIGDAIDKEEEAVPGGVVSDDDTTMQDIKSNIDGAADFDKVIGEFNKMVVAIQEKAGSTFASAWAPKIQATIEKYLGRGKKIRDATPSQVEQVTLVVDDLREQMTKAGI